jgi:predicted 3-demethylubiquinone-9 3-methyltransferase (glyoxalase superfamily)
MQRIMPCLSFDNNAEEAAQFYTSVFQSLNFQNSTIVSTTYYGEGAHKPKGTVMTVVFQLDGQNFMALNGGPDFTFSPAISLMVNCDTQQELDELWDKLSAEGGETRQCGWLKDKYGVSWQIVPARLSEMMSGDAEKLQRVVQAIWTMDKLDIDKLERAYAQQ